MVVVHWIVYQPNVLMRFSSLVDHRLFGLLSGWLWVSTTRKSVERVQLVGSISGTLLGPEGSAFAGFLGPHTPLNRQVCSVRRIW